MYRVYSKPSCFLASLPFAVIPSVPSLHCGETTDWSPQTRRHAVSLPTTLRLLNGEGFLTNYTQYDADTNSCSKPRIQVHLGLLIPLSNSPGKTISLRKCFCMNSLAYLFRHLEKTPNLSPTFIRNASCPGGQNWLKGMTPTQALSLRTERSCHCSVLALGTAAMDEGSHQISDAELQAGRAWAAQETSLFTRRNLRAQLFP